MATESELLTSLHRALIGFNKRAERSSDDVLAATFVDSAPLYDLLSTPNNQVVYGRRGTGKTHAIKFLADEKEKQGDHTIYIDLRSVGSNGSIYSDTSRPFAERASSLILDVINALYDELYRVALIVIDRFPNPEQITLRLDDLASALTTVKIVGTIEQERAETAKSTSTSVGHASATLGQSLAAKIGLSKNRIEATDTAVKSKSLGTERISISFGNVSNALGGLIKVLGEKRIWLLIDEWSEVPVDLQPFLADLFKRTILPVNSITVKIAAIEHRSNFAFQKDRGEYIGLELGADIAADLNLDEFLVFDNNNTKATEFFKNLIFKHYQGSDGAAPEINSADRLIQIGFTQTNVFDEFVRAVEGVPRDALNLAAKIATKGFNSKISMNHVRAAARDWFQQDKAAVIKSNLQLSDLLEFVIDEVIGTRRARAFLFPSNEREPRIDQLFDSRLLHILKRNISSRDEPGRRYDVYKVDYGCYVELINTTKAPDGLFEADETFIEVPGDDYRSIRRAILRLDDMDKSERKQKDSAR